MFSRFVIPVLLFGGFSSVAAAACPDRATLNELNRDMERAENAYQNLDLDGFNSSSDALRTDLSCLGEPMTRVVAARIHRIEGLRGHLDGDRRAASQSFAAARSLDPDYSFPEDMVPEGSPELELYTAMDISLGATQKVDPMIDGYVLFDGRVGDARPTDWATVVQVINEDGEVNVNSYLRPGQPMPSYYPEASARAAAQTIGASTSKAFEDSAEEDPFADELDEDGPSDWSRLTTGEDDKPPKTTTTTQPRTTGTTGTTGTSVPRTTGTSAPRTTGTTGTSATSSTTRTSPTRTGSTGTTNIPRTSVGGGDDIPNLKKEPKKHPVGLLTFSLLSAAASGVSYGVAMHSANGYRDPATTYDELDALRIQANLWSGVAAGTGLIALGSGIAVGVSW